MKHPTIIRIIDLAISGAISEIKRIQEQQLLIMQFGDSAVWNKTFFDPLNKKKNLKLSKDDMGRMHELLELAANMKKFREDYFDAEFNTFINAFKNQFI